MSNGGFKPEIVGVLLDLTAKLLKSENWRIRCIGLSGTVGFLIEHWENFKSFDISEIIKLLYDPEIEVRNMTGHKIVSILKQCKPLVVQKYVEEWKTISLSIKKKLSEGINKAVLHGCILGLISVIRAYGVEINSLVPDALAFISKFRNNYGIVSTSVRECLSEFWKLHRPIWEHEKDKFTEEQQYEISEHINPYNYFA